MNIPAFPRTAFDSKGEITAWNDEFKGMTLRDYFAAKALSGLLADPEYTDHKNIAEHAYKYADEMLKARG